MTLNAVCKELVKVHIFIESRHEYFLKRSSFVREDVAVCFAVYFGITCRDVDNSRKPGKLPGCERDFSGCKALLLSPKCF